VDLYLFDFDKTLYAYDNRFRLPALARAAGTSQYRLAKYWWAAGCERRAENGEWPTADEYLDEFARVTESRRMSLDEWAEGRRLASTPNPRVLAALARARELGTVSLLSNNPSVFEAALPLFAPDAVALLGDNVLVSAALGVRKPDGRIFEIALEHYGARPEDTFFVDDVLENVVGARALGIHAHQYTSPDLLDEAMLAFERRTGLAPLHL
jgi:putative hydrolase of the HAD superfamily